MKKYVKPMMESEVFVSNEFVSACWTIECTNSDGSCGKLELYGETLSPEGTLTISTDNIGTYAGKIGNVEPGCRTKSTSSMKDYGFNGILDAGDGLRFLAWLWDVLFGSTSQTTTTYFHPVKVTDGHTGVKGMHHPNASV